MKILQVIDTLAVGGAEKILVTLANLQYRQGDAVSVLTLLEPGTLAAQLDSGIPLVPLRRGWKFNPLTMFRFVRIVRQCDVLHVHSAHNLRYVFLAAQVFHLKKPIFFHEHYGNIEIDTSVRWDQRWIYPRVTLIGVAQRICDWAVHRVGVPAAQVHLLRNIVPEMPFQPRGPSVRGEVSILVTSNIRRPKHLEFALRVFAAFRQHQAAKLTIIGQPADPAYLHELKQMVGTYGLAADVQFVHDCTDVQPLLPHFDLALHTPVSESGPLVLIEYLAQGLPFISYQTGEVARMVGEAYPEYVLDSFDIPRWVNAMQQLLGRDRTLSGASMRQFYEAHFSETNYYESCKKIYRSALPS
ncbi:MAG: hypothetical protein RL181_1907 [Bacteroidota bacterium]